MNKLTDRSPMSQTDKLCLVALAGVILTAALADWAMDAAAIWAAEADKPKAELVEVVPPIDCTPLAAAMEAIQKPRPGCNRAGRTENQHEIGPVP